MKTNKKRALTIVTIVMMMMSLFSAMAFAEETAGEKNTNAGAFTKGTVNITAKAAGDTFDLYQIVNVSYDSSSNSATYAFTDLVNSYNGTLAEDSKMTIDAYQSTDLTDAKKKAFIDGLATYIRGLSNPTKDATATASDNNGTIKATADINNMGQYLVLATSAAGYVYMPMTATFAPNENLLVNTVVDMTAKGTLPTIVKTTTNDVKTVAKNDEVEYKITVYVPKYPEGSTNRTFIVKDILPSGFKYVADSQTVLADKANFVVNGQNLIWTFDYDKIKNQTIVEFTYKAEAVNPTAGANINNAELEYSNNPTGNGTFKPATSHTVYSYGLEITKVDAKDNTHLNGVVFEVYKDSVAEDNLVGTVTTDNNGVATLNGLALGKYVLKETKAATGYNVPADLFNSVNIELADSNLDGVLDNDTDAVYGTQITNSKGIFNLPTTGGIGTWVFTIAGIALLGLAVVFMLIVRRRQQSRA